MELIMKLKIIAFHKMSVIVKRCASEFRSQEGIPYFEQKTVYRAQNVSHLTFSLQAVNWSNVHAEHASTNKFFKFPKSLLIFLSVYEK